MDGLCRSILSRLNTETPVVIGDIIANTASHHGNPRLRLTAAAETLFRATREGLCVLVPQGELRAFLLTEAGVKALAAAEADAKRTTNTRRIG